MKNINLFIFISIKPKRKKGGFHPKDLERIKTLNIWLQRFLEQQDCDMKASLNMLWETCEWRKNFGTNGKRNKKKLS